MTSSSETIIGLKTLSSRLFRRRSCSVDRLESDLSDLDLPPLETFAGFPDLLDFDAPDCVSLRADSIELENDVFPSTPLTEEQFAEEVELGVPINQVGINSLGLKVSWKLL